MKILVIPDIHGSHEWEEAKKIILADSPRHICFGILDTKNKKYLFKGAGH